MWANCLLKHCPPAMLAFLIVSGPHHDLPWIKSLHLQSSLCLEHFPRLALLHPPRLRYRLFCEALADFIFIEWLHYRLPHSLTSCMELIMASRCRDYFSMHLFVAATSPRIGDAGILPGSSHSISNTYNRAWPRVSHFPISICWVDKGMYHSCRLSRDYVHVQNTLAVRLWCFRELGKTYSYDPWVKLFPGSYAQTLILRNPGFSRSWMLKSLHRTFHYNQIIGFLTLIGPYLGSLSPCAKPWPKGTCGTRYLPALT